MQLYRCSKAQLQKGEDALLQDVARMLVSCLQEHAVDRLQGGTYHLEILTSRSLMSKDLTSSCLKEISFWRRLVIWLDIWLIRLFFSSA